MDAGVERMVRKKVLITGGAGFIGGNFVQYMVNKYPQYDIYNLDLVTGSGDLTKHRDMENKENYHFLHQDIANSSSIFFLFEEEMFNYVVHFAEEGKGYRSETDPELFVNTNVLGTQALLVAAKHIGVEKFVHISTDEVYGDLEFDPAHAETAPMHPTSPYSASKASSDLMVRACHEKFGLPVNIIRCSKNYGPFQCPNSFIPRAILSALKGEKAAVSGNGQRISDWVHVWDHCAAIDLVLHEGVTGEIYHVCGQSERTKFDVVNTIASTIENSLEIAESDIDESVNNTKLGKLGWKPVFTFEAGIAQTIEWYFNNKWWWEPFHDREPQAALSEQYAY